MTGSIRCAFILSLFSAVAISSGGCGGDAVPVQAQPGPGGPARAGAPGTPGGASNPGIKQIMGKLNKGPNALTPLLKGELAQDPPPWDTILPQTKEFAAPRR